MHTHYDLFSGIGGFALAAKWAGFRTIGFSEIDTFCSKVLKKHWPTVVNYGDIRNINYVPKVTLMTGGFPCQPFSIAGKRKGTKDERYLWPQFVRIINLSKPSWVVIENVSGSVTMVLDTICRELEEEKYSVQPYLIPACAVGAPHKRERLWVVAHSNSERRDVRFDHWQKRFLQDYEKWNVETLQQEWSQFKPKSWETFNTQKWLEGKDLPPVPRVDDGIPYRVDRGRALGNAIVPQVIYPLFKIIKLMENF